MDGRVGWDYQADRILLKDGSHIDNLEILAPRYQFFVAAGKDKVVMSQYHRTDEVIDNAMVEGHVKTSGFVITLTLRYIERRELNIRNIAQTDGNLFQACGYI